MTFSPEFSSLYEGSVLDTTLPVTALPCAEVEVLTGQDVNDLSGAETYETYWDLLQSFASYTALLAGPADYAAVMYGHPGYGGGSPAPGSGGTGARFGISDEDGTQWWVTDVEGWEDGIGADPSEVEVFAGGSWVDRVRPKAREVTVKGMVVATSAANFQIAQRKLAACLSTPPHSGVLRVGGVDGMILPIVLGQAIKSRAVSNRAFEFEMLLRGRDVGTPGSGVWRESHQSEYTLTSSQSVEISTESWVSARPQIRMAGPLDSGTQISDGTRVITLASALPDGDVLFIDCARWQVSLNGSPARYMLASSSAPIEIGPTPSTTVTVDGGGAGIVRITTTELY